MMESAFNLLAVLSEEADADVLVAVVAREEKEPIFLLAVSLQLCNLSNQM